MTDYDPNNVFARILRKEIKAELVHEDQECVVFRDASPQAPTHLLVIPRVPIAKLSAAGPDHKALLGHLLLVCADVARQQGVGDDFRIVINNGAGAQQSVFHLHLHVIAGRALTWPPG